MQIEFNSRGPHLALKRERKKFPSAAFSVFGLEKRGKLVFVPSPDFEKGRLFADHNTEGARRLVYVLWKGFIAKPAKKKESNP